MKIKTPELSISALDHAVHIALGLGYRRDEKYGSMYSCPAQTSAQGGTVWDNNPLPYSTDWSQGGPIIEQALITLLGLYEHNTHPERRNKWLAYCRKAAHLADGKGPAVHHGPTPLVVAMRCFVASRLGEEVDMPEELT